MPKTDYKTIDVYVLNESLAPGVTDIQYMTDFYQKNIKQNLKKEQRGDVLAILRYQYLGSDQAHYSFSVYRMDNKRRREFTGVLCGDAGKLTKSPRSQIPGLNITVKNILSYLYVNGNIEAGESPTAIVFKDYLDQFKKAAERIGITPKIHRTKE